MRSCICIYLCFYLAIIITNWIDKEKWDDKEKGYDEMKDGREDMDESFLSLLSIQSMYQY